MPVWKPSISKLITLALAIDVLAQQQQPHDSPQNSSQDYASVRVAGPEPDADATNFQPFSKNERAVATVAPAALDAAVRAPNPAPSAAGQSSQNAGLSSVSGRARSLQDWEVENFVLLATVDGSIYARNRNTGQELWKFNTETPMVQTIYHNSHDHLSSDDKDKWMWIVEPNQGGSLYVFVPGPNAGIQKLGPTVKELADKLSPWVSEESPFVYTAEKRNTLITLNATNGAAMKFFTAGGSGVVDSRSCRSIKALEMEEEEECEPTPTINIGRIEYIVSIQNKDSGQGICTIKYFEWIPNNRDKDLQSQYSFTMDNKYIYSHFDGGVTALEHSRGQKKLDNHFLYTKKFASPVVRVFDVARPQGAHARNTALVLLAQPVVPVAKSVENGNVFVNCTESGSWYALSESSYPSVTDGASKAKCCSLSLSQDPFRPEQQSFVPAELVGIHSLADFKQQGHTLPLIDGPSHHIPLLHPDAPQRSVGFGLEDDRIQSIDPPADQLAATKFGPFSLALLFTLVMIGYLIFRVQLQLTRKLVYSKHKAPMVRISEHSDLDVSLLPNPVPELVTALGLDTEPKKNITVDEIATDEHVADERADSPGPAIEHAATVDASTGLSLLESGQPPEVNETKHKKTHRGGRKRKTTGPALEPTKDQVMTSTITPAALEEAVAGVKHKKTHRGNRGGRAKKPKECKSTTDEQAEAEPASEELTNSLRLTNGIRRNSQGHQIIKDLVVTSKTLGRGSGGTIVFEGLYGGRQVAIKRMLIQYNELALQEVALLEQTDHHRNIVRYFSQQKDEHFLYIALEKCQASLYDVFGEGQGLEPLDVHQTCRNQINLNVCGALRQLAAGLNHLHGLRIVHRDLKPQNILVAYPRLNEDLRLVISDFGLCRSLPKDASTLAPTVAGGAGTSGWKAPELITNPRENATLGSPKDTSTSNEGNGTSSSGVKRAVDIFSLGCVFYYVLTNGHHPFDSETPTGYYQFEREQRILKGEPEFHQLIKMGADAQEPMHLISWMLSKDTARRPTAKQVLNHPFFWTPKQRLDFLVDVSDHWEREVREPPSDDLIKLEGYGDQVHNGNFLVKLDKKFLATLGKQRKYTGSRMLDLLRALRNKRNHYADMPDDVKARVGELPEGYLRYWTHRFPSLLISCYNAVMSCELDQDARFMPYFDDQSRD